MTNLLLLATLLSLTSCFQGPGLFQQSETAGAALTVEGSEAGGIVTGKFTAGSSVTQQLAASSNSAIKGSKLSVPAGALAIDTDIAIEEGASISGSAFASQLGLSGSMTAAGPSVVISSSAKIDGKSAFTLQIPMTGGSLALGSESERTIVAFKYYVAASDSYYVGVFTRDQIEIIDGFVEFSTKYFGSYQVAITEEVVKQPIKIESDTPILTKAAESKLEPIKWALGSPIYEVTNDGRRQARFPMSAKGFAKLTQCGVYVHENKSAGHVFYDYTDKEEDLQNIEEMDEGPKYVIENDDAHTLYAKFECSDVTGRYEISPWSKGIDVPAYTAPSTEAPTPYPLEFTGLAASTDPMQRAVRPTSAPNSIVLSGICDPSSPDVFLKGDLATDITVPCSSTGTFVTAALTTASFFNVMGGNKVYASQNLQIASTNIISIPEGKNIALVASANSLYVALNSNTGSNNFVILTADIEMSGFTNNSGNWVPPTIFSSALEGDGHKIKDLVVNGATGLGLLNTLNSSSFVGHLELVNPTITATGTVSDVGSLIGYANCGSATQCVVDSVVVTASNPLKKISANIGGAQRIGGLIGKMYYTTVRKSSTDLIVSANNSTTQHVGGLVGYVGSGSTIDQCSSSSQVTGKTMVGGLVGFAMGTVSYQTLITRSHASGVVSGELETGGLVGKIGDLYSTVSRSYSSGSVSVTGNQHYIGGLVGANDGIILDSYSTGSISAATAVTHVGGLVGVSGGIIGSSYSTSSFTNSSISPNCGGLVGYVSAVGANSINNSFATGTMTGCTISGGIAGNPVDLAVFNNVQWFAGSSGNCIGNGNPQTSCTSVAILSAFQDGSAAAMSEWDFTNYWYIPAPANYPLLTGQ
jgi:hypothetical protein